MNKKEKVKRFRKLCKEKMLRNLSPSSFPLIKKFTEICTNVSKLDIEDKNNREFLEYLKNNTDDIKKEVSSISKFISANKG